MKKENGGKLERRYFYISNRPVREREASHLVGRQKGRHGCRRRSMGLAGKESVVKITDEFICNDQR